MITISDRSEGDILAEILLLKSGASDYRCAGRVAAGSKDIAIFMPFL